MCSDRQAANTVIDVRLIPPPVRHALIFSTFENLGGGECFRILNDHDPRPLFYKFNTEYPGIFDWTYERDGPDVWQIRIDRLVA